MDVEELRKEIKKAENTVESTMQHLADLNEFIDISLKVEVVGNSVIGSTVFAKIEATLK